ncbi:AraC family transcriptional regulator [Pseudonocardia sp. CA-142604]|uniref:AraC family transcriptional regulator n=1 Tax=Pseudonocardia sp. CA-142604 TaxID=3240024 RepID=UPI003D91B95B
MQIREFSGEELEDVAGEFFLPMIARTGPGFRGRVAVQELGEALTLSRSHWGEPMMTFRTDRMAARASTCDRLLFCVYSAGRGRVRQHDRSAEQPAGTGVLCESRSRFERVSSTETWSLTLRFPRQMLPLLTAEITEACARSVAATAPAMQMLSAYLDRLFDVADDLTDRQRTDAGHAAIALLAMALRDVTPSVPGGGGPEEVLLDMMRRHVRERLADPHLRVEELARRHHVSVSHAYTLFERIGTTPGAYLREERLQAAQAMLSDRRQNWRKISDIAAAVGFLDLRTFERAFRRRYGMTPGGWRQERPTSDPLPQP